MNSKEKKPVMTEEDIMKLLDSCYEKCLNGIPKVSPSVEELANDYLKKHDLLNEKGSRNTFDVEKLKSYILKTKEEDCFWPIYSRMVHDPIENQVYIQSDIVLIEGNYLLSKDAPWNELLPLCDDSVFLNVDTNILKERLIKRKSLSIGLNKAIHFYEQSDSKNIQYVLNSKQCPNIEIELSTR